MYSQICYPLPQTCTQQNIHTQQACSNGNFVSPPDNLNNNPQQSITTFSANSEMPPKQAAMKSQNNSHTSHDPKNIAMSKDIVQFLLDNLLIFNAAHKSAIDNMKSISEWRFGQLYAACKDTSMSINGSALADVNKVITKCNNIAQLLKSMNYAHCSDQIMQCRQTYSTKNNTVFKMPKFMS